MSLQWVASNEDDEMGTAVLCSIKSVCCVAYSIMLHNLYISTTKRPLPWKPKWPLSIRFPFYDFNNNSSLSKVGQSKPGNSHCGPGWCWPQTREILGVFTIQLLSPYKVILISGSFLFLLAAWCITPPLRCCCKKENHCISLHPLAFLLLWLIGEKLIKLVLFLNSSNGIYLIDMSHSTKGLHVTGVRSVWGHPDD